MAGENLTSDPAINDLLTELRDDIQAVLGDQLIGLYLFGSLVTGDFDPEISDLDLVAATAKDVDERELARLKAMHEAFVARHPQWHDRIEVAYISLAGLATCQSAPRRIARISPGEPLHFRIADRLWLMDWYLVRERGRVLFGPPPTEIIPPITKAEFISSIRELARTWWATLDPSRLQGRRSQSYAVLSLCRTLYTCRLGEQPSKLQAAAWAARAYPQWQPLIEDALRWRKEPDIVDEDSISRAETMRFIRFVCHNIGD